MCKGRITMLALLVLVGCVCSSQAWGGLFNRFSSDALANFGYGGQGHGGYHHYGYGQVDAEDPYDALEGNRIDEVLEEASQCFSTACITNGDCCQGYVCLNTEDGGRCLPPFSGRKLGEICNRENLCDAGLVCEEVVPGEMHVCRPPLPGRKQFNDDCSASSDCDITRGLCCILQRRHRQKQRKSCGYFKDPVVCIGPVATDHAREYGQHIDKRMGGFRMH